MDGLMNRPLDVVARNIFENDLHCANFINVIERNCRVVNVKMKQPSEFERVVEASRFPKSYVYIAPKTNQWVRWSEDGLCRADVWS
jgi:hypothetical protein